jgi:diguanylate cyclase (GGDEF)-like protein/PAS domain S-box-containing protein
MDSNTRFPYGKRKIPLREAAERKAKDQLHALDKLSQADRDQLLQELQIHQIELELQNEELKEAHLRLEYIHRQYLDLYNEAPVGYASLDDSGLIVRCNRTLIELLGTQDLVMHGHALAEFMLEEDQPLFRSRFKAFCNKPENKNIDVRFKCSRCAENHFVGRIQGRRMDSNGHSNPRGWRERLLVVVSDVTELKRSEEKIAFQAHHDNLTGLPNRSQLCGRLETALAQASRHGTYGALLFMDLDRFKTINDFLGHQAGDELLIQFSKRLHKQLRREDLLVRMGGDEFVLLLSEQFRDSELAALQAQRLASHLMKTLDKPLRIMGNQIQVAVSLGVTVFPFQSTDQADDVIRQADTAMYLAKSEGRKQIRFFHAELERQAHRRLNLESDLRGAMEQRQFEIHYQPQISSSSGRIVAVDALLRWRHPEKGLLDPTEFIQVMEETGLIVSVGHWILQQIMSQAAKWQASGYCPKQLRIAVNISPCQMHIDQFAESVEQLLKTHGLEPACLLFEITENLLLPDDSACYSVMRRLEALGLTFSVDDFGNGYSSLFMLQKSNICQLKIAQRFVRGLEPTANGDEQSQHNALALVHAIISMAKALDINVVAEGVKTEQQRQRLAEFGCDLMQGLLFAPPMTAEEMTRLLERQFDNTPPSDRLTDPAPDKASFSESGRG